MLASYYPSAIIWTDSRPAYQSVANTYSSVDIHAIQSWIERERDLAKMRQRGNDWDGFEASAPESAILDRAEFFLRTLRVRDHANPPMRLALSPDGSVAFEWLDRDSFMRAEIENSDEVEWMVAVPGHPTDFQVESLASSLGPDLGEPEHSAVSNFGYAIAR